VHYATSLVLLSTKAERSENRRPNRGIAMRWFALLALIVPSAAVCSGSNAQAPATTGTIAFGRGPGELWLMSADGSGQRALTQGAGPVWSPDGRRIAYMLRGPNHGYHLFVINANGSGRRRLTRPKLDYERDQYQVWSPDGRRIAFERYDSDPNYAVYVAAADGSGERVLARGQGYGFARPAWSPGGRLIAFTHVERGAVYVIRPNGTGWRVLATIPEAKVWAVKWSPDLRLIAFIRDDYPRRGDRREELWVMNADGTQPRRLVDARVDNRGARRGDFAWSPDSRQIAFTQCCRDYEIFVVNADGSGLRQLTDNYVGVFDGDPVWSPDGRAIAFTSGRDGNAEIYVMNADGSGQRNISQSPLGDYDPAWSPSG
jgi:Tol biopolymer transport system component